MSMEVEAGLEVYRAHSSCFSAYLTYVLKFSIIKC